MSYHVVELALWILAAYFAGCLIGAVAQNRSGKGGARF